MWEITTKYWVSHMMVRDVQWVVSTGFPAFQHGKWVGDYEVMKSIRCVQGERLVVVWAKLVKAKIFLFS